MTNTGRLTGVKNSELIHNVNKLNEVMDSMVTEPSRWVFVTKLNWHDNGFVLKHDVIIVPSSKTGTSGNGDIVASVDDYVLNLNDGRRIIISTPELKDRVAKGDYGWFSN